MNNNIRRLRELRALSQRELAARANLSVTTVNQIETLGVTPEELLAKQARLIE
jgi:transcriptional regulator with XRE-family HTH domain